MKQPKRRRYNSKDMSVINNMMISMCHWLFRAYPSSVEYLELRTWVLHGKPEDPIPAACNGEFMERYNGYHPEAFQPVLARLPLWATRKFLDQLNGVIDVINYTQVTWCFWIDGRFMSSDEFQKTGRKYAEIDNGLSRHVWTKTLDCEVQKVW